MRKTTEHITKRKAMGLLALAVFTVGATAAHAAWMRTGGPTLPEVSDFVVHGNLLFMGTDHNDHGEVFVSQDDGATWSNGGLQNGGVSVMMSYGETLFVGGYLTGLYRTQTNGESWERIAEEFGPNPSVEALIALEDGSLLAGLDDSFPQPIFRSTDGGDTWTALEDGPNLRCYTLIETEHAILAGGEDVGVWRSVDGGATWSSSSNGMPADADVHVLTLTENTLFAAAGNVWDRMKVYRSEDDGQTWEIASTDLPELWSVRVHDLEMIEDDLYLAASAFSGEEGLYRSTDNGESWSLISSGVPGDGGVRALIRLEEALLIGGEHGVYRSSLMGEEWTASSVGASGVCGGRAAHWTGERLLVGNDQFHLTHSGVQYTEDFGDTWNAASGEMAVSTVVDFLHDGDQLYAAHYGSPRGVSVSQDGGQSFSALGSGMDTNEVLRSLAIGNNGLLAGSWNGLWRLDWESESWTLVSNPGVVYDLAVLGDWVYAGLYPGGVLRTQDDGDTWEIAGSGLPATVRVNQLLAQEESLYAALNDGRVMQLEDGAWQDLGFSEGIPNTLTEYAGTILVGTAGGEVWAFPEDGAWRLFTEGLHLHIVENLSLAGDYLLLSSRASGFWLRPLSEVPISTSVIDAPAQVQDFALSAYPNPFNPSTTIPFSVTQAGHLSLRVYDLQGRLVETLTDRVYQPGQHLAHWHPQQQASGMYLIHLEAATHQAWTEVLYLK